MLMYLHPLSVTWYATALVEVPCLQRIKSITISFKGSSIIDYATASLDAFGLQQMWLFKDIPMVVVVIQFPSGVVPSAEMAGFTPCTGIYWSEIFLQGACPCLPPTSVF